MTQTERYPAWVARISATICDDARAECPVPPLDALRGIILTSGYSPSETWLEFMRAFGGLRVRNPLVHRTQPAHPPRDGRAFEESLLYDSSIDRMRVVVQERDDTDEPYEVDLIEAQTGAKHVLPIGAAGDMSCWYIDCDGRIWWKNRDLDAVFWGTDPYVIVRRLVHRVFAGTRPPGW